jgi:peptide/nickel transport system substrate-binding protein
MFKSRPRGARLALLVVAATGLCVLAATAALSVTRTARAQSPANAQSPAGAQSPRQLIDVTGLNAVSRKQTLVVSPWYVASTISNPTTFNIYAPGDLSMHGIGNKTAYEALAYYSPTSGKAIPWLATSWRYSNNFKTITVRLRKGVKWSDGVPFTSRDVKFTFDMLKANAPTLQYSSAIKSTLKSVAAPNPSTVIFHLTSSNSRWASTYITVGFENHIVPLPQHIWKGKNPKTFSNQDIGKGWPVGTGPYKLVKASSLQQVWDENPNYWGSKTGFTNLPAPKRIIMVPGASDQALSQLYIGNSIDTGFALQPATYKAAASRNSNLAAWSPTTPMGAADGCFHDIVFNNAVAPWNNRNVRLAVNYALNRQQISALTGGINPPAVAPFSSLVTPYVKGTKIGAVIAAAHRNHQDLSLVAKYMQAAGYAKNSSGKWAKNGSVLKVPITGPQGLAPESPILEAQLDAAGFDASQDIRADNSPWATEFLNGQLGLVNFVFCQSLREPYDTLQNYDSSQNVPVGTPCPNILICTRYSNPSMDKYIKGMGLISNPSPKNKKYMTLAAAATKQYLTDMPNIMFVEENWIVPTSDKYWTGWPNKKNAYEAPFPSWEGYMVILHHLKPAK